MPLDISVVQAAKEPAAVAVPVGLTDVRDRRAVVDAVRRAVAVRRQDAQKRAEEEAILEAYLAELGMA